MNLEAVMEEVAEQLRTIQGLRVFSYPADDVVPPAAVVGYPEVKFDQSYGRGLDRWELPVWVVAPRDDARAARRMLSPYLSGSGDKSIKACLDDAEFTECDFANVQTGHVTVVAIGDADYLAAEFTVDVAGSGE